MAGRPTKFTTATKRRLYKALRVGASKRMACECAGVSYETMRTWERRGEEEVGPYSVFLAHVKKAQGEAALKALESIQGAMGKHWQAAAWYLERRFPEDWGKNRSSTTEALSPPMVVEIKTRYSDPWLEEDGEEEDGEEDERRRSAHRLHTI